MTVNGILKVQRLVDGWWCFCLSSKSRQFLGNDHRVSLFEGRLCHEFGKLTLNLLHGHPQHLACLTGKGGGYGGTGDGCFVADSVIGMFETIGQEREQVFEGTSSGFSECTQEMRYFNQGHLKLLRIQWLRVLVHWLSDTEGRQFVEHGQLRRLRGNLGKSFAKNSTGCQSS